MSRYRLTAKAKADLRSTWAYIAADNIDAADRVEDCIYSACAFLTENPLLGHTREDLTSLPVRFWTVVGYTKYIIVYDAASKPLKVLRILHGSQNIAKQLKGTR